jgi:hypothetical protein
LRQAPPVKAEHRDARKRACRMPPHPHLETPACKPWKACPEAFDYNIPNEWNSGIVLASDIRIPVRRRPRAADCPGQAIG